MDDRCVPQPSNHLREQRKRTWKGDGDNLVFVNTEGRYVHRHTLNRLVIRPTLKKAGIDQRISIKDTRASFITNALDENERLSFIQKQVGHTTTRMIVDHYYLPCACQGWRQPFGEGVEYRFKPMRYSVESGSRDILRRRKVFLREAARRPPVSRRSFVIVFIDEARFLIVF